MKSGMRLRLRHITAIRSEFPWSGQVRLQLQLDGRLIASKLSVAKRNPSAPTYEDLPLPGLLLAAGPHVLSIRVGSSSTTTYRILEAQLVAAERK